MDKVKLPFSKGDSVYKIYGYGISAGKPNYSQILRIKSIGPKRLTAVPQPCFGRRAQAYHLYGEAVAKQAIGDYKYRNNGILSDMSSMLARYPYRWEHCFILAGREGWDLEKNQR